MELCCEGEQVRKRVDAPVFALRKKIIFCVASGISIENFNPRNIEIDRNVAWNLWVFGKDVSIAFEA